MSTLVQFLRSAAKIGYDNATSGLTATNVKAAIDELDLGLDGAISDISDIRTLTGTVDGDVNLGTFTGVTIPDSSTVKGALQSLETAHENLSSSLNTFEWQESALDYIVDNTAVPPTEVSGDRYVLSHDGGAPNAGWDGASAGDVVEFDGTNWVAVTPTTGTFISIDDANDRLYYWGGASWTEKYFEATTASTGLVKVGFDIRLDSSAAGAGLGFAAGVLSVNVDDVGIEIVTDTLQLKDLGVTTAKLAATSVTAAKLGADVAGTGLTGGNGSALEIDFSTLYNDLKAVSAADLSSTANGLGASIIGVEDAAGNYTATDVEGVLTEIDGRLDTLESATTTDWTIKTAAYTAVDGDKILADTVTVGAFTITLPATPTAGDEVIIRDAKRNTETNAITVARNGSNIGGLAEDLTIDVNGAQVHLVYVDASQGWSVEAA